MANPTEGRERGPMTAETLEALRGSIAKWRAIVAGTDSDRGPDNCALCQRFDRCDGCPVAEAADDDGCSNTPFEDDWFPPLQTTQGEDGGYWAVTDQQKAAAQKELDFLISLLPPGETP